jgi:hypothetical protein
MMMLKIMVINDDCNDDENECMVMDEENRVMIVLNIYVLRLI